MYSEKLILISEEVKLHPSIMEDVIYYFEKHKKDAIRERIDIPLKIKPRDVYKILSMHTSFTQEETTEYYTVESSMNFKLKKK
jgi:hypothetical protein